MYMKILSINLSNNLLFKSNNNKQTTKLQADNNNDANEVYQRFKDGETPKYTHQINTDINQSKLIQLSEKYKTHPTIKNKKAVLNQERKILYEELSHPELTLARNYNDIRRIIKTPAQKSELDGIITNFNLTALARLERMHAPFETKYTNKKLDTLERSKSTINSDSKYYSEIYDNADLAIDGLLAVKKESLPEKINLDEEYKILKKDLDRADILEDLVFLGDKSDEQEITPIIEKILQNDSLNEETKLIAIWGAGKFRSNKNFEIIKNIALNKDEKNLIKREYAIGSTALYLKEKPDEVNQILNVIMNDGTIFEPLAKRLKDKVNGTYYNQEEREFLYNNLGNNDIENINSFNKIYSDKKLNRHKMNAIDGDLIPFRDFIHRNQDEIASIYIINDTMTKIMPELTGKRDFNNVLLNCGDFNDSIDGMHTSEKIVISNDIIGGAYPEAVVGHELGHELNEFFDEDDNKKLTSLYKKARKDNRLLNYYAGRDEAEYFAVGCEAYCTEYKPHKYLLTDYGLTKYTLLEKDPELYNFIKNCLNKY